MMHHPKALFLCFLAHLSRGSNDEASVGRLVVTGVTVPQYGVEGKHAVLYCSYYSDTPVYSVRWYKNGKEFYSFRPGRERPISVHPVAGVTVEVEGSSIHQVKLSQLTLASTGRYRCEVSQEGPFFATDSKFGDLLIVVVPRHGPSILGGRDRYQVGDQMRMNCTSGVTLPPANLTWYINQKPAAASQVTLFPVRNISRGEGEVVHQATVGLQHRVRRKDFQQGTERLLRIKCVASIYDAYYKVVEMSVGKQRRHKEERREGKRREGRRRKEEMRKEEDEEVKEQIEEEDEGLIYLTRKQPHSERQGFPKDSANDGTSDAFNNFNFIAIILSAASATNMNNDQLREVLAIQIVTLPFLLLF